MSIENQAISLLIEFQKALDLGDVVLRGRQLRYLKKQISIVMGDASARKDEGSAGTTALDADSASRVTTSPATHQPDESRSKCPFCNSGGIGIIGDLNMGFQAWCLNCHATGPKKSLKHEAREAWNTRPTKRESGLLTGYTLVPNAALAWLYGEEGSFEKPEKARGNYWWRSVFRKMIEADENRRRGS